MAVEALRKLVRYSRIYGPSRALNKAAGRTRPSWLSVPALVRRSPDTAVIGCGQFAFNSICFFLRSGRGSRLRWVYDVQPSASRSLARFYRARAVANSAEEAIADPETRYVYIASNHASHADYAVRALAAGKTVHVEKPVALDLEQLARLTRARRQNPALFAGYNRPFSAAVRQLREEFRRTQGQGVTLDCMVNGHVIGPDHWYRRPEEGTRVCGNLGHWIDLTVHVLAWRGLPERLDITLNWADEREPDDNLSVVLTSEQGDLVSLVLTARAEPFEGISEAINLQYGDLIARIDDFRRMDVWRGARRSTRRYWPKDVGHRRSVLQPFARETRAWGEVEASTLLMIRIKDMVLERRRASTFVLADALDDLEARVVAQPAGSGS